MPRLNGPALPLLLGTDPRQRLRLLRSLTAAAIYALSLIAQWQVVRLGLADRLAATCLTVFIVVGVCGFLAAIRSGVALPLEDAALTLPQMVFAILMLALAYWINPQIRGILPMIVALVLVFGAFTLSTKRCRHLGWFAVAVFGVTMAMGAWRDPQRFEPMIEAFHFLFVAAVLPTLSFLAGQLSQLRIDQQRQKRELRDAMARLTLLATHDELTGLPNRRHVQEFVSNEVARRRRGTDFLCLAIIDLDHFKRVNDTFGHAAGDAVLRVFAREARTVLRTDDVLARWGGEEFLLVMPNTTLVDAESALERLRRHMALPATWVECPEAKVTFSVGLTTQIGTQTLEQVVHRADSALYEAKHCGRDQVRVG